MNVLVFAIISLPFLPLYQTKALNNGNEISIAASLTEDDVMKRRPKSGRYRNRFKGSALWDKGVVPYIIEPDLERDDRVKVLQEAFALFHQYTCLTFRPYESTDANFIRFIDGGYKRCWSFVGRVGGDQELSMGSGCEVKLGVIIHEMAHALGFLHEHQRPDRDQYITILYDNVKPGKEEQFEKYEPELADSLNMPYDYSSVMHYRQFAFTKEEGEKQKPTILTKNPEMQTVIGQRDGFSACDLRKINQVYKCPRSFLTHIPPCDGCADEDDDCKVVVAMPSLCSLYPGKFMLHCKKSCQNCGNQCEDAETKGCPILEAYCDRQYVQFVCPKTCGLCPNQS